MDEDDIVDNGVDDFGDTCIRLSVEDHRHEMDMFRDNGQPAVVVDPEWIKDVGHHIKKLENELDRLRPEVLN